MSDEGAAAPRNAAPLPWDGKPERADLILMGGIALSGLYLLALMPLTPSLVGDHPVILELLKGSMTAMITMGAKARIGEASLLVAVLAAIPGLMLFDWLYWWAGRRWGKRAIDFFVGNHPKAAKRTAPARAAHRALRLARDRDRLLPAASRTRSSTPPPAGRGCACARSCCWT